MTFTMWYPVSMETKNEAIRLRKLGRSYREIEKELGVARSTLSYWLKNVDISKVQSLKLYSNWVSGIKDGRTKGAMANRVAKINRLQAIDNDVQKEYASKHLAEDVLQMLFVGLYLGDGFKIEGRVGLGNADPGIVLLFVVLLEKLYKVDRSRLKAQIFARADQDESKLLDYWSDQLNLDSAQFYKTQFDYRTKGKDSHINYHGVCAVSYNDTLLQRKILAIGKEMIKYVSTLNSGS